MDFRQTPFVKYWKTNQKINPEIIPQITISNLNCYLSKLSKQVRNFEKNF
jgi:hypothetical protein